MKQILAFAAAFLLAFTARAEIHGTWTAMRNLDAGRIQLNIDRPHDHFGSSFDISAFSGLSPDVIATQGDAKFELRREAGVIAFDGSFLHGDGAGHFVFTPNANFASTLKSMGVRSEDGIDDDKLLALTLHDVSGDFIRAMRSVGYDEPLEHYESMRIFKVTPELVTELRSLGFGHLSFDDLIASRIHKVTPDYIRAMRAAGYDNLTMDDLVATRIHKATPEFIQQMASLGYTHLSHDDLIAFRIHGVSPEFVSALHDLGYNNVPAADLIAMRIHRVTPEYIRDVEKAGYEHVPVEKLIEMRIHGIDSRMLGISK
jgi:hypothetical protein